MLRGPLYHDDYTPQLSGHETFPLRYGWLKKAFDAVQDSKDTEDNREVFSGPDAIARFGVGKNMVVSMRHWANATGIIEESPGQKGISTTALGQLIFGEQGLDPFMEAPATSWLIQWHLCGKATKTTWFWAFHHHPSISFERETLISGIKQLAEDREWPRASLHTIRRDVACFIRTYVTQSPPRNTSFEDSLDSPLTELGLIRPGGKRDEFRFVRGSKPSLGPGVFCYAVTDFWNRSFSNANTLSFEALNHEPGSPARVFMLEENDMVDMLAALEETSDGIYRWSETAGLKQLIRSRPISTEEALVFVERHYSADRHKEPVHVG
ncbi:MAG: DUF4007 family protein [Caldilineaceae bacterium]|nr:DUF4007 family protein [Caldilineaceae bacterium]